VVIADGHHRYAISRTYRDERRSAGDDPTHAADLTLTYLGELVEEQLNVAAIHRLYRGVGTQQLREQLDRHFTSGGTTDITATTARSAVEFGALCFIGPDGAGEWLIPRSEAFAGVRDLDSARLEHALADLEHEVAYQHGVAEVLERVTTEDWTAGVLIRPVTVAEIERTASEGVLMPPKSTFFTPKLRTGLVMRPIV
jgi:uncharacterized protein (DUF1015 family)